MRSKDSPPLHPELRRQLERLSLDPAAAPAAWAALLAEVSAHYDGVERERADRAARLGRHFESHRKVLEALLRDDPLEKILGGLVVPARGVHVEILAYDPDASTLAPLTCSEPLLRFLKPGAKLDARAGDTPSGVAATRNELVEILDIRGDARCARFAAGLRELGVLSAYSFPLCDENDRVMAVFTVYSPGASAIDTDLWDEIHGAMKVARVALTHWRMKEAHARERLRTLHQSRLASLGELAAGVAHEINNPLAIIRTNADILKLLVKDTPPDVALIDDVCGRLDATTLRIAKIVRSLRTLARDGSDDPMDWNGLGEIVSDTLQLCHNRFRSSDVRMIVPDVPAELQLRCRPAEISQVILNLVHNAFEEVAGKAEGWVALECGLKGDRCVIRVRDSGAGIPAPVRERMFEPFYSRKSSGKATGLGLSICQGIIQAHGGSLYYNEKCANTEFVVELPGRIAPPAEAGLAAEGGFQ